jgi:hypothetical protein
VGAMGLLVCRARLRIQNGHCRARGAQMPHICFITTQHATRWALLCTICWRLSVSEETVRGLRLLAGSAGSCSYFA